MMNLKNKPMILVVIFGLLLVGCGSDGSGGGGPKDPDPDVTEGETSVITEGETSVNTAPEIISAPKVFAKENTAYIYKASAIDKEGDTLRFSLTTAPLGMEVNPDTGTVSWIPSSSQGGEQDVSIQVDDGKDTKAQAFKVFVETSTLIASKVINTCDGGTVEVNDSSSDLFGSSITLPQNSSCSDNTVSISQVLNPMFAVVDLKPVEFSIVPNSSTATKSASGSPSLKNIKQGQSKTLAASALSLPSLSLITIKVTIPPDLLSNLGQATFVVFNKVTGAWDVASDAVIDKTSDAMLWTYNAAETAVQKVAVTTKKFAIIATLNLGQDVALKEIRNFKLKECDNYNGLGNSYKKK